MICFFFEKMNDFLVFYFSEEEFKDFVVYIKRICCDVEKFGVCVIVFFDLWKVCYFFVYLVFFFLGNFGRSVVVVCLGLGFWLG